VAVLLFAAVLSPDALGHGTVVAPTSRVYRVYQSNPENPGFPLAANAVAIDGTLSYYTWNEVSRNIPEAVQAGLPPGFDYSPWMPDGQIASAGRVDPLSTEYPRTDAGLDQVSADWPTTTVVAGGTVTIDFLATAPHDPSVWDVWMTTPGWDAGTPLTWGQMEFLGRPVVAFSDNHYTFELQIPADRSGHHVLWVAWQRDDPVGEVFISTSDIDVQAPTGTFEDEAHGFAGTHGIPTLAGDGTLLAGDPVSLTLTNALENAATTLIVGLSELNAAFKGGVLVPEPDILLLGLSTDATGALLLSATWPPGIPSGSTLFFQHWITDAAGPLGLAASNAVSATAP
jgi:chitin-binding protein